MYQDEGDYQLSHVWDKSLLTDIWNEKSVLTTTSDWRSNLSLKAPFGCKKSKCKGSPYSITEHTVLELIPVRGSRPAGDVSHKTGGRLPLLSARLAVTPATLKRAATNLAAWWTEAQWAWTVCLRLLPDSVATAIWTRALPAPESSTLLTTRLPSHPVLVVGWVLVVSFPQLNNNHKQVNSMQWNL